MDIARLPLAGGAYPGGLMSAPSARQLVLQPVARDEAAHSAASQQTVVEPVLQGEVLSRESVGRDRRSDYSATRDYLNARLFDARRVTPEAAARPGQANRALGAYLSHTREQIQPQTPPGRQVDYFI